MPALIRVEIYSRLGCHLCDEAKEVIGRVRRRWPFELRTIDVDRDPALQASYGDFVPVVLVNGKEFSRYQVEEIAFERTVENLWKP